MKCEICKEVFVHSDKEEDLCPDCECAMKENTENIFLLSDEAAIVFRNDGKIELVIPEDSDKKTYNDLTDSQLAAEMTHMLICEPKSIEILTKTIHSIREKL